jgi:hypothetical protein
MNLIARIEQPSPPIWAQFIRAGAAIGITLGNYLEFARR